jgi:hypothetical protein
MSIHVVNKGKEGEREVCRLLNQQLDALITANNYTDDLVDLLNGVVQRNQNQSAVGGGDINLFGLSIEVKRQETLSIPEWWRQATTSAKRNGDKPILIYRQNRKAWHVVMDGHVPLPTGRIMGARVTISVDDFLTWFTHWVEEMINSGKLERV